MLNPKKTINLNIMSDRITALYIRVSTDEQAREGYSIPTQIEKLTAFAKANGKNNIEIYTDDGYTAKNARRPDLQRLIKDVKKGKISEIYTLYLDRIFRNLRHLLNFVSMLKEYNTSYVCATLNFDTANPFGKAALQLFGAVAELESNVKSVVVKEVMGGIVNNQQRYLAVPPFGFALDEKKKLVTLPDESYFVSEAADYFIGGHGLRATAIYLNGKGITTRNGNPWTASTVRQMLTNELYIGTLVWNRRYYTEEGKMKWRDKEDWIIKENAHPPILTMEQWNAIQERISRRMPHGGMTQAKYRLSGMCRCGHCGAAMVSRRYGSKGPHRERYIFVCSGYQKNGVCKFHYMFVDDLDKQVCEAIESIAGGNINITEEHLVDATLAREKQFARRLELIDQRMQKQIQGWTDGLITGHDLKIATDRAEKERELIQQEKERAATPQSSQVETVIQNEAKQLLWLWNHGELSEIHNSLRILFDGITILDGQIYIEYSKELLSPE
jgi:site-specific DNA recombinase